MTTATDLARRRRLARICDADGLIRAAAIDHPETYAVLFDRDLSSVTHEEIVDSKLELIEAMAPHCTAMLLDPPTAWGPAVLTGALPGNVGSISGLEALYFRPDSGDFAPRLELREGWGPERLVELGVDMAKLVVFHREGDPDCAGLPEQVAGVADRCRAVGLPLVIEPLWYPKPDEDTSDPTYLARRTESVLASTRRYKETGADIMKVEFPVDLGSQRDEAADACARLDAAAAGPWVLLSAGVTFDGFVDQMRIAAPAGASGFMAGRAIWGDAVGRFDAAKRAEGARTAQRRLDELSDIVRAHSHPAYARAGADEGVALGERWFVDAR